MKKKCLFSKLLIFKYLFYGLILYCSIGAHSQVINFNIDSAIDDTINITETIYSGGSTYVLTISHPGNEEIDDLGAGDQIFYLSTGGDLSLQPYSISTTKDGNPTSFTLNSIDYDTFESGGIAVANQNDAEIASNMTYSIGAGSITFTNTINAENITAFKIIPSGRGVFNNFGFHNINVTFTTPNTAPVATAFNAPTVAENATNVTLSGASISDVEAGDTQTVTVTATGGTITLGGSTAASVMTSGNASTVTTALSGATFTPTSNFNGAASISVVSNDGTVASNTATVMFTITAVNDEPSFTVGANQTVGEDAGVQTVTAFAADLEDGDVEVTQTLSFTLSNNNNGLFSTQPAIDASGNLTYTPAANVSGNATVMANISDDGGTANAGDDDTSDVQTFVITVDPINDEPSFAIPGTPNQTVVESTSGNTQTVNAFASMISDGDGNTQALTFNVTNNNNGLFDVQPSINVTTGNLTYTVATNQKGIATITVNLMDNGGTVNSGDDDISDNQNFTIQVIEIPTITSITDDSGASATDFITSDNQPSVLGTATPNSTIFLIVNGNSSALTSASTTTNATGNYTFPFPVAFGSLPDAPANLSVTSTLNGTTTASAVQVVTIDTANPVYTSSITANFVENGTGTAYTAVATDDTAVTYTITDGADQGDLSITTAGVVTFNATPDFEVAVDDNMDNNYVIDITATDLTGNTSVQTVIITVTDIDEIAPRVASITRQSPTTSPTNADTLTWDITFDEAVVNVDVADFEVIGTTATITSVTNPSGNVYRLTLSGGDLTNLNGTIFLEFAGGSMNIADTTGNTLSNFSPTGVNENLFVLDNNTPTVTITSILSPGPTNENPIPVTITFSKEVDDFIVGDIIVGNGTKSNFMTTDNIVFTVDIIPVANSIVTVDVNATVATDNAGNDNDAAMQFTINYDSTLGIGANTLAKEDFFFINPVASILTIESSLKIATIIVYDLDGVVVALGTGSTVEMSGLASGIYMTLITTQNGKSTTKKVVKK